ncbi:MAG: hypothetical protein HKO92_12255 [Flavobacteriaceae bacterium]|nr:hypothetical protein [Flavobacteriaceae bacterium]
MTFLQRLGYYLGGLSIGIIFLAFFLSGKRASCDYGPEARVLKNINIKKQHISKLAQESINKLAIDSVSLANILRHGNVNFSKSNPKLDSCKIYVIEGEFKTETIAIEVENCETKATLLSVKTIDND